MKSKLEKKIIANRKLLFDELLQNNILINNYHNDIEISKYLCEASCIHVFKELTYVLKFNFLDYNLKEFNYGLSRFYLHVNKYAYLFKKYGVEKISISIPPEIIGNRLSDLDIDCDYFMPSIIEITLLDKNGNIFTKHPKYKNKIRINEIEELINILSTLNLKIDS